MNYLKELLLNSLIIFPVTNHAADNKLTVTAGVGLSDGAYAGSGINIKYCYEFNEKWWAGISYTSIASFLPGGIFNIAGGYDAVSMGPFYRISSAFSIYTLTGVASAELEERWAWGKPVVQKDRSPVASTELQFNPWLHFVIDASWEYFRLLGQSNNIWILGVGYHF